MFTHKDISTKTIFVINCIDSERRLRVNGGQLMLEESDEGKHTTLTKFPFQKILALFVIGPITITTPLIDKCKRYGVALVVMKTNLRPVFVWADSAEANFLLRKRQFEMPSNDLSIAKFLVRNKIENQYRNLIRTRRKDEATLDAAEYCLAAVETIEATDDYERLMGIEGSAAKIYFGAYFLDLEWKGRHPRAKCDAVNVTLDIGYTILFNYMETFLRMFGFDLYISVYHRLWFKRKSLVCDMIEPFRCIIDHTALLAFHKGRFKRQDFMLYKQTYRLKPDRCGDYYRIFYDALISRKVDFFKFVQQYYRCFMGCKSASSYIAFEYR